MITKLILYLHQLLSVREQQAVVHHLIRICFPGQKLYKARPIGYKRPKDPLKTPMDIPKNETP